MDHRSKVLRKIIKREVPKSKDSFSYDTVPRGTKISVQRLIKFMKGKNPEAIYKIINNIQKKPFHWLIGGLGGLGALDLASMSGKLSNYKRGY